MLIELLEAGMEIAGPAGTRYVIIVSTSHPEVFETLRSTFAEPVVWDRRKRERRSRARRRGRLSSSMPGRRERERRSPPPPTWAEHGFVLVAEPVSD